MTTEQIKEKILDGFWDRINLRIQQHRDPMNSQKIASMDWFNESTQIWHVIAIPDNEAAKEADLIETFRELLMNQMFYPKAKTRLGKWLVKKICKHL